MIPYKGVVSKQILIKVTSRGRKDALLKCVSEAVRLAKHPEQLKWLFTVDFDDTDMPYMVKDISELIPSAKFRAGYSDSKIHAINRDARDFPLDWNILVNLSDDQLCVMQDWDEKIKQLMPPDTDASLWFNDGRQDQLNTMEIIGRKYYERFGYIYHPSYKSFFADNEANDVAGKRLIKSNECLFKHLQPKWVKESHLAYDETYTRHEKYWDQDHANYRLRKLGGFKG